MADVEHDPQEIDHLIRNLTVRKPPVSSTRRGGSPAAAAIARPVAPILERRNPFGRLMDVSELVPSRAGSGSRVFSRLASALALPDLPALPDVRRFRLSGPVAARIWVCCGVALGIAMIFWPYPKTYVWGLVLYLQVLGLVLLSGIWGARLSWDARLGSAHTVALMTAFWAVVLGAVETLPLI